MQWLQELEVPNSAKQVYKFSLPALDLMGLLGLRERLLKLAGAWPGFPHTQAGKGDLLNQSIRSNSRYWGRRKESWTEELSPGKN